MTFEKAVEYDFYADSGKILYRTVYHPTDDADFERVMKIFKDEPKKYKPVLINCTFDRVKEA